MPCLAYLTSASQQGDTEIFWLSFTLKVDALFLFFYFYLRWADLREEGVSELCSKVETWLHIDATYINTRNYI